MLFGINQPDRRRGPPRWTRRPDRLAVRRAASRDRLRARGSPPGRAGGRLLDRRERHPADPADACSRASSCASSTERGLARRYTERLRVRATGMDQLVQALSGGNQQKVVIAKWLATNPARPDPRRADPRRGHRREGRGPPDHLRARCVGPRDHPHLQRAARGPGDERPDPRPPRGPRHRRDSPRQRRPRSASCSPRPARMGRPTSQMGPERTRHVWRSHPVPVRRPMAADAAVAPARRSMAARVVTTVGRSRELTLVGVMVVLGLVVTVPGAAIPVALEPQPGDHARRDHRDRRRRRGARHHHQERRPLGRVDDRPRRLRGGRHPEPAHAAGARQRGRPGSAWGWCSGWPTERSITLLRVPSIVATLGTLSILPRASTSSWPAVTR